MSNIVYNEKEEAFELPYKIWENMQTVRFYVEDESEIMDNLSAIAQRLAKLDGSRRRIASMLIEENYYEGGDTDALVKNLSIENVYVDIDEDEIVVCIDVDSFDGYMSDPMHIELFGEDFEITGTA
ncbi:MAG: hypothetical protein IJM55_00725 [Ruminococcus sp.]|nr:hypothetical protein [Ruminococcus sp.]